MKEVIPILAVSKEIERIGQQLLGRKDLRDEWKPFAATYYAYINKLNMYYNSPSPLLQRQIEACINDLIEMKYKLFYEGSPLYQYIQNNSAH